MCGSLERKAQRGRKANRFKAWVRDVWSGTCSAGLGSIRSLTVCAGYLCGRLQLDQQIHLAESSIKI